MFSRLTLAVSVLITAAAGALTSVVASIGPWTVVTPQAAFSPRDTASGAVFNNMMWLSHGYPEGVQDLWSSADGATWQQVLGTTPYELYSRLIVFDGKLWAFNETVWSSEDGVIWELVLPVVPFPPIGQVAVMNGEMWVFGNSREVWSSSDGVNWTAATLNAPYGDRNAQAIAVFDNKLWLMGGSTPAPGTGYGNPYGLGYPDIDVHNDVWSSADGSNWTLVTANAPWGPRMWFRAEPYAGRLWIMGGYDNDAYENLGDTWYTTDGVNWQQTAPAETSWSPRHFATSWVANGNLWIGAGNSWPFMNDVWTLHATAPTTTTLTASDTSTSYGEPILFTATVSPTSVSGTVDFVDGGTTIATVPLTGGTAVFETSALWAGAHSITAVYAGDVDIDPSTSSPVAVDVQPLGSPAQIATSFNPTTIALNAVARVSFTITNPNPALTLNGVGFTDELPSGLLVANPSGLTGSCGSGIVTISADSRTISLSGGSLPGNGSCTLELDVVGLTTGTKANQTSVVTSAEGGAGNSASATLEVIGPDLAVTKSHSDTFTQGDTGKTFTVTVTNVGTSETTAGVTLVDTLPMGFIATSIDGSGWTCTLETLTCTRNDALSAASAYPSVTLTVSVAPDAPPTLVNSAQVSGGGQTNPSNDTATDEVAIIQLADLTISKTHSGDFAQGDHDSTYTITVSNSGLGETTGVVNVVDTLPLGLTATAIGGNGWNCTLATLTCTRADTLAASAQYPPLTVTVDVALDAPPTLTNVAHVDGGGEIIVSNNEASDVTTVIQVPDLTITKTHSGNFAQGQIGAQYTIAVSNIGVGPTVGIVTVADVAPDGLTVTGLTGTGWTCNVGTASCSRTDVLAINSSYPPITVTFNVNANASATLINTATVSVGRDRDPGNNTDTDPTTVLIRPANVVATAISVSQITISWEAVAGATNYQVFRSGGGGPFELVGFPFANGFTDPAVAANTAYLYYVRATDATNVGPPSSADLATTTLFTDDPIVPGSTVVRAAHIRELQSTVNLVRAAAGLAAASFSSEVNPGSLIRSNHIAELRSALTEARSVLGLTDLVYTDPVVNGVVIKATHIRELRSGIK